MPATPPPDATALRVFPALSAPAAAEPLYRIWQARDPATGEPRTPWFFSSLPSGSAGRFDLPAPSGTCYFSDRRSGAWLEVFRGCGLVDRIDVERRRLLTVVATRPQPRLADLRSPRARRFGVTADLAAGDDYTLTHRWAHALRDAGFGGISGTVRHDPTHAARTVAVFGRAGPRSRVAGWRGRSTPLVGDTVLSAELAPFGTGVVDRPWDVAVQQPS